MHYMWAILYFVTFWKVNPPSGALNARGWENSKELLVAEYNKKLLKL